MIPVNGRNVHPLLVSDAHYKAQLISLHILDFDFLALSVACAFKSSRSGAILPSESCHHRSESVILAMISGGGRAKGRLVSNLWANQGGFSHFFIQRDGITNTSLWSLATATHEPVSPGSFMYIRDSIVILPFSWIYNID